MPLRFGQFELDDARRQLLRDGEEVHLAGKQFHLLQILVAHRPNAISRQELYDRLWPSTFVSDANLPGLIADLRAALGDDARNPHFIRTIHGFGYAFCGDAKPGATVEGIHTVASLSGSPWHVQLPAGETVIGRDPALRDAIDDASVSRRHAAVVCSVDSCAIRDLGSKNGTSIGGVRIAGECELREGDVVTLGSVRLTFHRAVPRSTMTLPGDPGTR
ncbi:MAG TPA: winged helix-turn-helix domain-containing protein [Thermoanaerobaculia bacterium]